MKKVIEYNIVLIIFYYLFFMFLWNDYNSSFALIFKVLLCLFFIFLDLISINKIKKFLYVSTVILLAILYLAKLESCFWILYYSFVIYIIRNLIRIKLQNESSSYEIKERKIEWYEPIKVDWIIKKLKPQEIFFWIYKLFAYDWKYFAKSKFAWEKIKKIYNFLLVFVIFIFSLKLHKETLINILLGLNFYLFLILILTSTDNKMLIKIKDKYVYFLILFLVVFTFYINININAGNKIISLIYEDAKMIIIISYLCRLQMKIIGFYWLGRHISLANSISNKEIKSQPYIREISFALVFLIIYYLVFQAF